MAKPEELIGKVVSNVSVGLNIAFINFTDGTSISIAAIDGRVQMMRRDPNQNPELEYVESFNEKNTP